MAAEHLKPSIPFTINETSNVGSTSTDSAYGFLNSVQFNQNRTSVFMNGSTIRHTSTMLSTRLIGSARASTIISTITDDIPISQFTKGVTSQPLIKLKTITINSFHLDTIMSHQVDGAISTPRGAILSTRTLHHSTITHTISATTISYDKGPFKNNVLISGSTAPAELPGCTRSIIDPVSPSVETSKQEKSNTPKKEGDNNVMNTQSYLNTGNTLSITVHCVFMSILNGIYALLILIHS